MSVHFGYKNTSSVFLPFFFLFVIFPCLRAQGFPHPILGSKDRGYPIQFVNTLRGKLKVFKI